MYTIHVVLLKNEKMPRGMDVCIKQKINLEAVGVGEINLLTEFKTPEIVDSQNMAITS